MYISQKNRPMAMPSLLFNTASVLVSLCELLIGTKVNCSAISVHRRRLFCANAFPMAVC